MKKITLFTIILFALTSSVKSQITGEVTLNVNLNAIQTLIINQQEVNLNYVEIADYANGVTSLQENHLKIYSTGAFNVKVKSLHDQIARVGTDPTATIESSGIFVTATQGASGILTGAELGYESVGLTTTDQLLISSNLGTINTDFNITYKGQGGDAYVNKYFNNEIPTVYTTTVIYTIAAQ